MLLFSMKAMEVTPITLSSAGTKRSGAAEHRAMVRPGAPARGQLL